MLQRMHSSISRIYVTGDQGSREKKKIFKNTHRNQNYIETRNNPILSFHNGLLISISLPRIISCLLAISYPKKTLLRLIRITILFDHSALFSQCFFFAIVYSTYFSPASIFVPFY